MGKIEEKGCCASVSQNNSVRPAQRNVEDNGHQEKDKIEPRFQSADVSHVQYQMRRSENHGYAYWLQGALDMRAQREAGQRQPAVRSSLGLPGRSAFQLQQCRARP